VAELTKFDLEFLYQNIGWPLARKYGDAYEAFKKSIRYATSLSLCLCASATRST